MTKHVKNVRNQIDSINLVVRKLTNPVWINNKNIKLLIKSTGGYRAYASLCNA